MRTVPPIHINHGGRMIYYINLVCLHTLHANVRAKASFIKMRILISISLILFALTTFGQKNIRKAYILVDGKPISYQDYKTLNLTQFPEIKVLAGNDETIKIFGKKAKNGIVHLKTRSFLDNQKSVLDELRKEYETNNLETTLLVINGVPFDSNQVSKEAINKLNSETVEIISVPDIGTTLNHRNKKVIVITTNVGI